MDGSEAWRQKTAWPTTRGLSRWISHGGNAMALQNRSKIRQIVYLTLALAALVAALEFLAR